MNKNDLKTYCREHAGEELTAEARALLDSDPALQQEIEQIIFIKRLIALKKHEQPQPGSLARCQAGVQARISAHHRAGLWARLREWLAFEGPAPATLYATTVLALVLLGSALLYSVGRTGEEPVVVQSSLVEFVPVTGAELPSTPTNGSSDQLIAEIPTPQKPIIMLRVDKTSEMPSGHDLNYGGQNTTPVSYEP